MRYIPILYIILRYINQKCKLYCILLLLYYIIYIFVYTKYVFLLHSAKYIDQYMSYVNEIKWTYFLY